jgi:hypothetical protein
LSISVLTEGVVIALDCQSGVKGLAPMPGLVEDGVLQSQARRKHPVRSNQLIPPNQHEFYRATWRDQLKKQVQKSKNAMYQTA